MTHILETVARNKEKQASDDSHISPQLSSIHHWSGTK